MKDLIGPPYDEWRLTPEEQESVLGNGKRDIYITGMFIARRHGMKKELTIITSSEGGFDFVGSTLEGKAPSQKDIDWIREWFFNAEDTVSVMLSQDRCTQWAPQVRKIQ